MFLAFSSGAALLVIPEAVKVSPKKLATVLCHRNCPTVIQVVLITMKNHHCMNIPSRKFSCIILRILPSKNVLHNASFSRLNF